MGEDVGPYVVFGVASHYQAEEQGAVAHEDGFEEGEGEHHRRRVDCRLVVERLLEVVAVGRHYPHFEPFQITLPYPLDSVSRQIAVAPVLVGSNESQETAIASGIEGVLAVDVSTTLHLPTERR